MKYRPVKYKIMDIVLFAVENDSGYIAHYCNTRKRAKELSDKLN